MNQLLAVLLEMKSQKKEPRTWDGGFFSDEFLVVRKQLSHGERAEKDIGNCRHGKRSDRLPRMVPQTPRFNVTSTQIDRVRLTAIFGDLPSQCRASWEKEHLPKVSFDSLIRQRDLVVS